MPVTWAGARRINSMVLVAVPNAGSIHSLEAMLYGNRVGLSYTTLAASVIARMPSVYQLIPPKGAAALARPRTAGSSTPTCTTSRPGSASAGGRSAPRRCGGSAAWTTTATASATTSSWPPSLARARDFHRALAAVPLDALPGQGDRARRRLHADPGPLHRAGEAGHVPPLRAPEPARGGLRCSRPVTAASRARACWARTCPARTTPRSGSGYPEVARAFIGSADHHGIYKEPTFQSVLLRQSPPPAPRASPPRTSPKRRAPDTRRETKVPLLAGPGTAQNRLARIRWQVQRAGQLTRRARRRRAAAATCEGGFRGGSRTPTLTVRECPP